ncbi:MAG: ankyrin repeat domain-containing protein [Micavibrio sp.]|nr:ankyrin repeat domain-containing protein [Micavibrio sp.]
MKIKPSLISRFTRAVLPQATRLLDAALTKAVAAATPADEENLIAKMTALLRRGARMDTKNADGMTALGFFCQKGFGNAVAFALENGAQIYGAGGAHGTALEAAAATLNQRAMQALTAHCKEYPLGTSAFYTNALTKLLDLPASTDAAETRRALACGQLLLDAGAEMSIYKAQDIFSRKRYLAPLIPGIADKIALAEAIENKDNAAVEKLLADGLAPDCYAPWAGGSDTPLLKAVKRNDIPLISLLLAHQADPSLAPYDWMDSPIRFAVRNGLKEAFELLLNAGGEEQSHDPAGKPGKNDGVGLVQLARDGGFPDFSIFVEASLATREKARMEAALKTMAVNKTIHVLKAPVRFRKTPVI